MRVADKIQFETVRVLLDRRIGWPPTRVIMAVKIR